MKIIDRLPFADRPYLVTVRGLCNTRLPCGCIETCLLGRCCADSYPLEMPQGISVFPEGDAPRLPLIGLRTIVANRLTLVIDGDRRYATLKTKGWF